MATVRQKTDEIDIPYRGKWRVTISGGVASVVPDSGQTESSLIREADQALYRAKQQGRNRIVCA